jgi:mRNA interferase MazF
MNKHLQTITIAPMTTQSRNYPTRGRSKHNEQIGWVVLDQIRTIDKQRILKILGKLADKEIIVTKNIIRETLWISTNCGYTGGRRYGLC